LGTMIARAGSNGAARKHVKAGGKTLRVVSVIDRSGFLFQPDGLSPRAVASLVAWKKAGKPFAEAPGGRSATPGEALAFVARHALADPILIDVTADQTGPVVKQALQAGMDVVLANKRPLSGP